MIDLSSKIESMPVTLIGRFLYHCLPYRKKVVLKNINRVFSQTLTQDQQILLAKAFYSHFAISIKEMLQLRFMSEKSLQNKVKVVGYERLLDIAARGKGVLIVTGHFGNWEFAPLGGILNFKEFKGQFHFIRKTLGNKFIEKLLFKRYYESGLNVIPKKNSLSKVTDALDKNHAVVFVLDQHASIKNKDGIAVEFFGEKAGTYRSLAMFARYTNIPVVPAAGYRTNDGNHVLEFHEPIYWQEYKNTHESIYNNTLEYNKALEKIILQHPEQWLWIHKRWKL